MIDDPRKAKTLGEACINPDGKTYNGYRALSWLSGIPLEEVERIGKDVIEKKKGNGR